MSKTQKRVLIWGGLLVILVLIAWPKLPSFSGETQGAAVGAGGAGSTSLQVSTYVAEPQTLQDRVITTGTLLANEEVLLRSEVSGKIEEIFFREGRPVQEGELLVKINDSELQAQRRQADYRIRLAEEREGREKTLLERGGISQEQYDATLNVVNVLRSELELIDAQLEKTELRAPFDGVIGLRSVSVGSYISPSTPIATIQDVSPIKVEFSIPERYVNRVSIGSTINFRVEGMTERFQGEVYAFEPKIEAGTRTLTLRALAPNAGGRILPGAFADIELVFEQIDDALAIPAIALIPELGGQKVFVYKNGKAEAKQVETGIRTEQDIQITSGLAPQDTVITSGIQQLRPGLAVELIKIASEP